MRLMPHGNRHAKCVGIRDGMARFDSGGFKHQGTIYWDDMYCKLVDDADGALGLLQALFSLDDIEALAVVDQRKECSELLLPRSAKHLPNFLRCWLPIQISHHRPRIEDEASTVRFAHADAPRCARVSVPLKVSDRVA
jgi:hypothetical protein